MCGWVGLEQAQLPQLQENHKPMMQTFEQTSNHSTWNSSALPSNGRLAPRREYFAGFQIHAMEQGAGSFFSLHGHGQLICSLFFPPVWLQAYGSDYTPLCPCFWSHAAIQFTWQLTTFLPPVLIVSVSFWLWLLACRIALIKKLMKGNANEHFACILSESSSFPSLFPRESENEELGVCYFLWWELIVQA